MHQEWLQQKTNEEGEEDGVGVTTLFLNTFCHSGALYYYLGIDEKRGRVQGQTQRQTGTCRNSEQNSSPLRRRVDEEVRK